MAPLPPVLAFLNARFISSDRSQPAINGLGVSSLELDTRSDDTSSALLSARDTSSILPTSAQVNELATRTLSVLRRDTTSTFIPGQGSADPSTFNNKFFFALFALLGAAMVIASLWFFFWAKNGGFHFRQGDWDDYKSTVLRRKGPDGKTLSNATKSTKLGGSTIAGTQHYKWQKTAARSVVGRDEKGRKGILAKRGWAHTHSVTYSDDYMTETFGTKTVSDMTEVRTNPEDTRDHSRRYRDRDVHDYKREKPARVGGLNRPADGSHFDPSSVNGSDTMTESSERPILSKSKTAAASQASKEKAKERAERKAREDAKRMERRWKQEAEEAAAAIARDNPPPPAPPAHRTSATPSAKPSSHKRHRSSSRSASPKKREPSYQRGPASEILSTAYTSNTSGTRTSSYYDEYRPRAAESSRGSSDHGRRSRQSSPKKGGARRNGREGGYRRGADSDLE